MNVPILRPEHHWECPSCDHTDVTFTAEPHSRMHNCKGLAGLTAPMVPAGTRAHHTRVERGDYLNGDEAQTDGEGRVVMSVITERWDGSNDTTVYAAPAQVRTE